MPDRKPHVPPHKRALIVTAWIDEEDMRPFSELRSRFFPGERNFLHAHVTLFHHIRSSVRERFIQFATERAAERGCNNVRIKQPFLMGKGVAYALDPQPLIDIREPLRKEFAESLTPQDARPWKRPHITVQNKVSPEDARQLLRHLEEKFEPCTVRLKGYKFFRYDYGPWTELGRAAFSSTH